MESLSTFLQIDLQNLFFEAKNKGQRIDFEKIWSYFNGRETEFLTDALVYMIRGEDFDSSKFETKLLSVGYKLRIKNSLKLFREGRTIYRQTNHDVGITIDAVDKINSYSKWILMSGDGDFAELAKYLRQHGKKIEIWSFKECYNSAFEPYADRIHFIDEDFFYKKPRVSVFGFTFGPQDDGLSSQEETK
jgi:uncharacterized LabA/DUF88 family protein